MKEYQYEVTSGDSWWSLAEEYRKVKTDLSNEQAQQAIKKLNPSVKTLKVDKLIKLPFKKASKATNAATNADTKGLSAGWLDTVNKGLTDPRWDEYDDIIKTIVKEYNTRFSKKSRYVEVAMPRLEWKWIKAMIWVESGGPDNPTWKTRTMHIGNKNDKGLPALKNRERAADIIMDDKLKKNLGNTNTPRVNIKAGTAYLLTRLSKSEIKSLPSATDKKEHIYTIRPNDNLSKIAQKVGSTLEDITKSNPKKSKTIKPKDTIKYHKASMERVITGWHRPITAGLLASKYNGKGDNYYAKKLTYVYHTLFPQKAK